MFELLPGVVLFISLVKMKSLRRLNINYLIWFSPKHVICNKILMLDRKTNDKIRTITSISCTNINGNNVKWISSHVKKIWYLLHVCCIFLKKQNNHTIGKSSTHKSLSSVNIHSLTCSFTERFYLFVYIPSLTCNIHSLTGVNSLFM